MTNEKIFITWFVVVAMNNILFDDNLIIQIIAYVLFVYMILSVIINGIIFSKKKFACLECENEFKLKWYQLAWASWRNSKKYRRYKKYGTETYEMVYVKCPKCKAMDSIIK